MSRKGSSEKCPCSSKWYFNWEKEQNLLMMLNNLKGVLPISVHQTCC